MLLHKGVEADPEGGAQFMVQPDYEVDMEPKPVSERHDPQLKNL